MRQIYRLWETTHPLKFLWGTLPMLLKSLNESSNVFFALLRSLHLCWVPWLFWGNFEMLLLYLRGAEHCSWLSTASPWRELYFTIAYARGSWWGLGPPLCCVLHEGLNVMSFWLFPSTHYWWPGKKAEWLPSAQCCRASPPGCSLNINTFIASRLESH